MKSENVIGCGLFAAMITWAIWMSWVQSHHQQVVGKVSYYASSQNCQTEGAAAVTAEIAAELTAHGCTPAATEKAADIVFMVSDSEASSSVKKAAFVELKVAKNPGAVLTGRFLVNDSVVDPGSAVHRLLQGFKP